ncbi:hypothetical protein P167DRAFT_575719 [Morchella conica CCBAS932]|uniref:Uncharacterized protein n=1 Tax=Morchella conica CCBAS932 TaxID=1392247 RepID=A0A3N4KKP4_9PEZI|nr:hypothetical protein P167DRAFT_575719 [Morchella conica CCBAS932]
MLSRAALNHDNTSNIFLDDPPLQANRMVDLSISEGHITIDPKDTKYFCAAVSYYNDIYKITTEVRSDGLGLETQRADVSAKIEALEMLYHGPNSSSDLRIGLLWFKVLYLLENHVEAYNVIRQVNRKTQKFSPWLFKLVSRSRDLRKRQDESIAKLAEKARANDPPKSLLCEYSLDRMRDFVIPDTVVEDFDLIMRLLNAPAKCDHARLFRHIVISNHNLEGRLNQLLEKKETLREVIIHGINHVTMRKNQVANSSHVIGVLKQSYNILVELMDAYSEGKDEEEAFSCMGSEMLIQLHNQFLKPIRCHVQRTARSRGESTYSLRAVHTGTFKLYPNNPLTPHQHQLGPTLRYCVPSEARTATYNLFMARIVVSYILRRFRMLPLLIRTEDILYYRHVRSCTFTDGNLYHLANFFGTLQIQAAMIAMAQDENPKKPSVRHSTFVLNFVKGLTELLNRSITRSSLIVQPYSQTDWHTAIPFEVCPKNSYRINFHKNKEPTEKAIYARILIGPFRPWRKGNVAVYLQNSPGYTLWLTCVNLVEPKKLDTEIKRVGDCCGVLINSLEEQNLVTVAKKETDPSTDPTS